MEQNSSQDELHFNHHKESPGTYMLSHAKRKEGFINVGCADCTLGLSVAWPASADVAIGLRRQFVQYRSNRLGIGEAKCVVVIGVRIDVIVPVD